MRKNVPQSHFLPILKILGIIQIKNRNLWFIKFNKTQIMSVNTTIGGKERKKKIFFLIHDFFYWQYIRYLLLPCTLYIDFSSLYYDFFFVFAWNISIFCGGFFSLFQSLFKNFFDLAFNQLGNTFFPILVVSIFIFQVDFHIVICFIKLIERRKFFCFIFLKLLVVNNFFFFIVIFCSLPLFAKYVPGREIFMNLNWIEVVENLIK